MKGTEGTVPPPNSPSPPLIPIGLRPYRAWPGIRYYSHNRSTLPYGFDWISVFNTIMSSILGCDGRLLLLFAFARNVRLTKNVDLSAIELATKILPLHISRIKRRYFILSLSETKMS
jgi:hypothetical protein